MDSVTVAFELMRLELDAEVENLNALGVSRFREAESHQMESDKEPTSVEEALDVYWVDKSIAGHVPNYAGFEEWIARRFEALCSRTPLPLHAGRTSYAELPHDLLNAAKAGGVQIMPDGAAPDPARFAQWDGKQSRLKRLNKSKLLLSYFKHTSPRWREVLLCLSKTNVSSDSLLRTSSQSEHRAAFFHAIAHGDQHTAYKLVGRLREEAHDTGEVAFLEATASFHSNRFEEAITLAREVPDNAIDWPRAFMLLLESQAYLGEFGPIEFELGAHSDFLFPECFIRYLCQITVENSPSPRVALERASTIIQNTVGLLQPGPGVFQMWNRHSCQLAVRFVERLRDASVADAAQIQTGTAGSAYEELENSLSFTQIQCALVLDGDLLARLARESSEDAYKEIVKRLMNYGAPGREEYFQAMATQWRIGDRQAVLENVLGALDHLAEDSSAEARQAIVWAYQEAKLKDRHDDAERLRRTILDIPALAERLRDIESTTANDRLEQDLSPMARVILRSAKWDLNQASNEDLFWKDSGMISLGFFRIIELEFNRRVMLPALHNVNTDDLEASLAALKSGDASRATKDAVAFWERMLPQIRRSKMEKKGLELGALELLLAKSAKATGPDIAIKSPIHAEILRRLTPAGADAFQSGALARLLDATARERFRNPPAHSRYVPLPVARECKQHVEKVLRRLIEFTIDPERIPTVH
ncbi:hypothetical protein [Mesorhizobium wenxiniae]|nr:hypothetical protein [Mesorhizobium wenxiniae]